MELLEVLEKINSVQVENTNRLDQEDRIFCENQERHYRQALGCFNSFQNHMQKIHDNALDDGELEYCFIERYSDHSFVNGRIEEIKERHVRKICSHFIKKYNVTLEADSIFAKYKNQDIDYITIVDEIYIQLGGFNFKEKAVNEIKEAMIHATAEREGCKVKIKGHRLSFNYSSLITESNIWGITMDRQKALIIFNALTHFDTGNTHAHWMLTNYYFRKGDEDNGSSLFEKHEIAFTKVKAIKLFKNCRVDIEFRSGEAALQFAKEYCGYFDSIQTT